MRSSEVRTALLMPSIKSRICLISSTIFFPWVSSSKSSFTAKELAQVVFLCFSIDHIQSGKECKDKQSTSRAQAGHKQGTSRAQAGQTNIGLARCFQDLLLGVQCLQLHAYSIHHKIRTAEVWKLFSVFMAQSGQETSVKASEKGVSNITQKYS